MQEYLYHYVVVVEEDDDIKYVDFFKAETEETANDFMDYLMENLMYHSTGEEDRKANISDAWYEKVETVKWKGKEHKVYLVEQEDVSLEGDGRN